MSELVASTPLDACRIPTGLSGGVAHVTQERPISAVVVDIIGNVHDIVHSELRLAAVELRGQAAQASRSGGLMAAGALFGLYALGLLLALAVLLLARLLDAWLATLLVLLVVMLIGGILVALGMWHWRKVHVKPEKTAKTVKENVSWMKAQLK